MMCFEVRSRLAVRLTTATSIPRETDPAHDHQRHERRQSGGLRRQHERARLECDTFGEASLDSAVIPEKVRRASVTCVSLGPRSLLVMRDSRTAAFRLLLMLA